MCTFNVVYGSLGLISGCPDFTDIALTITIYSKGVLYIEGSFFQGSRLDSSTICLWVDLFCVSTPDSPIVTSIAIPTPSVAPTGEPTSSPTSLIAAVVGTATGIVGIVVLVVLLVISFSHFKGINKGFCAYRNGWPKCRVNKQYQMPSVFTCNI